jgi:3-hydroxy-D-aspartate aldolase
VPKGNTGDDIRSQGVYPLVWVAGDVPEQRNPHPMPSPHSRRSFLQTAGLSAASVWIPHEVSGYSIADLQPWLEDDRLQIGVSRWELETPALCLDLDALDRNLARMQAALASTGIASRPHAKTHKCPAIARLQMRSGAVGICAAKLGEAEVMLRHGLEQVLLTTVNVTPTKIRRAMALRRWHEGFIQTVDNARNAEYLSDAALEAGVIADVLVDVSPGTRTGIPPGDPALELGRLVDRLPGLNLRGIHAYSGGSQHVAGFDERRRRSLTAMAGAADTRERFVRAGLSTEIFTGGGTGTYNIDHEIPGFTDVQVGSYVFMDCQYLEIGGAENDALYDDFEPSLTVAATVLNTNFEGGATSDAGTKALTLNAPDPIVVGERGISHRSRSDEFGTIVYGADASRTYEVGDRLELIVPHCDPVVNLYDHLYGLRGDRVEVIWPISARGRSV